MKKVLIFIILMICYNISSINKPFIKFGSRSLGYFFYNLNKNLFYPSSNFDNFYFYLEEKINFYFTFKYRFDFFYIDKNKYTNDINNLIILKANNYLGFNININKNNSFYILISPMIEKEKDQFLFRNKNKFDYLLKVKNFNFKFSYSNSYLLKEKEKLNHNFSMLFYFSFPELDFIKYKLELSCYFQHYIFEDIVISPLNRAIFSFEVAIDFNRIDFEDIFNSNIKDVDYIEEDY